MKEYEEIIKNKISSPVGTGVNLEKWYRIIIIENGKKKSTYDFQDEEQATQCYALLYNPNVENDDFILKEEVFLTIYYKPILFV